MDLGRGGRGSRGMQPCSRAFLLTSSLLLRLLLAPWLPGATEGETLVAEGRDARWPCPLVLVSFRTCLPIFRTVESNGEPEGHPALSASMGRKQVEANGIVRCRLNARWRLLQELPRRARPVPRGSWWFILCTFIPVPHDTYHLVR